MNCKVCGNAVSGIEKICALCGNDLEAQRREMASAAQEFTPLAGVYDPPPKTSSLVQEKDEAINRILYDGDGLSAKDRLEERRKKRQAEKAGVSPGLSALFTQERKPEPVPTPAVQTVSTIKPQAPVPASAPTPAPEEKPLRSFSSEFVFGEKPKPAPVPQPPAQPEQSEHLHAGQQSFAVPQEQEAFAVPPQPPAEPTFKPEADPYFVLTPSDEEQSKFDISKKNEEFQELLDKEFERLKQHTHEPDLIQISVAPEPEAPVPEEPNAGSYIQERIDEYLRRSDHDISLNIRGQEEPAGLSFDDLEKLDDNFAAVRTPATDEGFSFDGKDYGHAFSHGEKPWADLDIHEKAFEAQETNVDPEAEMIRAGVPNQEFSVPTLPQSVSYADFEQFDFAGAPEQTPAPIEYAEPVEVAAPVVQPPAEEAPTPWQRARNEAPTRESVAQFLDRPIEFPFDDKPVPTAAPVPAVTEPSFDFEPIKDVPAPAVSVPEIPVQAPEPPAPEVLAQSFEAAQPAALALEKPEFVTPFAMDVFGSAPVEQAEELSSQEGLPPLTFDLPEPPTFVPEKPAETITPAPVPDFVDLMTERSEGTVSFVDEKDDQDGPPAFYKAYTQGFSVAEIEAANEEAKAESVQKPEPVQDIEPVSQPVLDDQLEDFPDFLAAFESEPHGKDLQTSKPSQKRDSSRKQSDAKKTALSVIITILIVILVIVVACIVVLKLMPDSIGAYYIQDFVAMIQGKLGIGSGA